MNPCPGSPRDTTAPQVRDLRGRLHGPPNAHCRGGWITAGIRRRYRGAEWAEWAEWAESAT